MNFTEIIDERILSSDEVIAINYVLKQRSYKYISSFNEDILFPEDKIKINWKSIADIIMPKKEYIKEFQTYLMYNDGTHIGQNQHGESIKDPKFLKDAIELLQRSLRNKK
jgi:hypothetical protein